MGLENFGFGKILGLEKFRVWTNFGFRKILGLQKFGFAKPGFGKIWVKTNFW